MFTQTRLKLTAWYLLIIILISVSFSVAMYKVLTSELDRIEHLQRLRQERQLSLPEGLPFEFRQRLPRVLMIDPEIIAETKTRLKTILFLLNGGILSASALAGYFLAGITLRPIKEMVDEQNRFITDSSHELRTPITSLKTEIEVNLRDKKLSKETKKILQSNLEEVNNLQTLSDNLIKLAQYQKSNGNVAFEETSLKEIIDEAQKKVATLARHKRITIHNKVKDYSIQVNRPSILEALVVFLDNAIKYSHQYTSITLTSRVTDHHVVISVKDEGVGIAEEDIPHLFERFYRADKSRAKTDVQGYGLGLAVAKKIVDKHGGSIKVSSKDGEGTNFEIYLPVSQRSLVLSSILCKPVSNFF